MKKFIFGLIATVLFGSISFAQSFSDAAKRNCTSAQMVTIVNVSKAFYTKGQSYDGFLQALMVPSPTYPSQDLLFRKIYSYVSNGTPDCDIMKADNTILLTCAMDLSKDVKFNSTADKALSNPPKKWWQVLINWAANAVIQYGSAALALPPPAIIDFWPNNP